jgi:Na+/proline symporter
MTAKDASTLRTSVTWLVWFPFCFFVPVILIGVTAAAVFPTESTSTFHLVAFELAQRGVFPAACSVVLLTACMASFMSTADSIVIAIAAVVTMDMYKAIIMRGEASVKSLDRVKSLCSVATIAITIGVALYADVNFLSMLNIGNGA